MPHFEIHATNMGEAKSFYAGLFGWSFSPMAGAEEKEYVLIEGRNISMDRDISGGMMRRIGEPPASGSPVRGGTMTFEVDDCDTSYDRALKNGGAEALPTMDHPGIGRCAYGEDDQGNIVGLISTAEES